jgi:hypothetical protein
MAYGADSERIRTRAWERYIEPQIRRGQSEIEVAIKPLMKEMESEGFPPNHPRQFCKALQKKAFLQEKKLLLSRVDGPPSGTSTTVVLHYRYGGDSLDAASATLVETPKERAMRIADELCGLFKDEIASFGGTEGFMRWVRSSDDDEDAA